MNVGLREAKLNFDLKKNIGQEGANSDVYIAHDKQFDAKIVIKRIEKSKLNSPDEYYREAKCLYASAHQNVVSVNYSCEDDEYIYIAMPYYKNGSIESLLSKRFLTTREIIKYSFDFLSGLNHIHTNELIHFDVKPTNVLISDSNEGLITDFGLTKYMNEQAVARADEFYGWHRTPESFITDSFTIQADIYQAGLTMYRMCNGTGRFKSQLESIFNEVKGQDPVKFFENTITKGKFPDRKSYLPHIPNKLRRIINKALNVDPAKRHNNLIELMNELSSVDELLDWEYSKVSGKHVWTLMLDNKTYTVLVSKNKESFNIETTKHMHTTGKRTKESANTKSEVPVKELNNELQKIFKSY